MTERARLFHIARRVTGRCGRVVVPSHLALNLSFVLHEASDSASVRRTAEAAALHAVRARRIRALDGADIVVDGIVFAPDEWFTVRTGYPHLLVEALSLMGVDRGPVATVDGNPATTRFPFFRAPAGLALAPHHVDPQTSNIPTTGGIEAGRCRTVGVVALVARPGGSGAQLIVRGPYQLSGGVNPALRQLESLIQSYANQWMPERALWAAPAEVLLGDEVR